MPVSLFRFLLLVGLFLWGTSSSTAAWVYTAPPAQPKTKHRFRLKPSPKTTVPPQQQGTQQGITSGLYLTFGLLFLLPVFVVLGLLLTLLGSPLWLGLALILLGNGAALLAGWLAGRTNSYSTKVLQTAVWVFFVLNLVGVGLALWWSLWVLLGVVAAFALLFLIWGIGIGLQKSAFKRASQVGEELNAPSQSPQ